MANFYFLSRLLLLTLTCQEVMTNTEFQGQDIMGQNIIVTNGVAEPMCDGPDQAFECGVDAVCSPENRCECPEGTDGDPQVICTNTTEYYTNSLTGDPVQRAFDGAKFHVYFPCRNKITRVTTKHHQGKAGGKCTLLLHAILYHMNDEYYVLGFDITGTFTDRTMTGYQGHFSLRIFGYGKNGTYVFKTQGNPNDIYHVRNWGSPTRLQYMDSMVELTYDEENNFVIVAIPHCGWKSLFRPKVKHSGMKSGLVVQISKAHEPIFCLHGFPLASSPVLRGRPMIKTIGKLLSLTRKQASLFLSLHQEANQDFGGSSIACLLASREMTMVCSTTRKKAFALRMCGFLYTDLRLSVCLHANAFGGTTGSLMAMCFQAMCLAHAPLCKELKKEIRTYNCPIGAQLKRLPCEKIKRTLKRMYPQEIVLPAF